MGRFLPKSLLGQTLMAVALALLLAQTITSVLIYRIAEDRREEGQVTAIVSLIWGSPMLRRDRGEDLLSDQQRRRPPRADRRGAPPLRPEITNTNPLLSDEVNDRELAARIASRITDFMNQEPHAVVVTKRLAKDDPVLFERTRGWRRTVRRLDTGSAEILVAAVQWTDGGVWHVVRVPNPRADRTVIAVTTAQTLVIFVVLMTLLFFVLRRITRPLARLTERVGDFASNPDRAVVLEESGPSDTRQLIAAHNAMEARIAALLDEKDVMLGAIGHDLKTPLAALRVRIESVPDDTQRARMADSIEDITRTLDDILTLARVGRSGGTPEVVDLGALAIGIVEEFEDLEEPVTINDPPRLAARVQETWLKRAVRNLVSNAVRYGGSAELSVLKTDGHAVIRVDDNGPGITDDQIETMLEPFTRGEASRNRATGGAGLGLTLARAIAEQHGGTLELKNRSEGGLRAEIRLPLTH